MRYTQREPPGTFSRAAPDSTGEECRCPPAASSPRCAGSGWLLRPACRSRRGFRTRWSDGARAARRACLRWTGCRCLRIRRLHPARRPEPGRTALLSSPRSAKGSECRKKKRAIPLMRMLFCPRQAEKDSIFLRSALVAPFGITNELGVRLAWLNPDKSAAHGNSRARLGVFEPFHETEALATARRKEPLVKSICLNRYWAGSRLSCMKSSSFFIPASSASSRDSTPMRRRPRACHSATSLRRSTEPPLGSTMRLARESRRSSPPAGHGSRRPAARCGGLELGENTGALAITRNAERSATSICLDSYCAGVSVARMTSSIIFSPASSLSLRTRRR